MMGSGYGDAVARMIVMQLLVGAVILVLVCLGLEHLGIYLFHHMRVIWAK